MFYYLYQITNNVNGKIYVGVHKTQNLDDGYMGSGRIIRSAIQKYGLANFSKVILEFFENAELMYAREKEVVNDEFLLREDVYNLRRGGNGGFDYINRTPGLNNRLIPGYNASISPFNKGIFSSVQRSEWGKLGAIASRTKEAKAKRIQTRIDRGIHSDVSHMNTPEINQKRKDTFSIRKHQCGQSNSQYGKCWISHIAVGTKKCSIDNLPEMIEQGWVKGRNKFK